MIDRNGHPLKPGDIVKLWFVLDQYSTSEEQYLDQMPGRVYPMPCPSRDGVCEVHLAVGGVFQYCSYENVEYVADASQPWLECLWCGGTRFTPLGVLCRTCHGSGKMLAATGKH